MDCLAIAISVLIAHNALLVCFAKGVYSSGGWCPADYVVYVRVLECILILALAMIVLEGVCV